MNGWLPILNLKRPSGVRLPSRQMITVIYDDATSADASCRLAEMAATDEKLLDDEVGELNRKSVGELNRKSEEVDESSMVAEAGSLSYNLTRLESKQSIIEVR